MAQIVSETILVTVNKLFKSGDIGSILDEAQLAVLAEVIESTVAEILGDSTIVIEVTMSDE